METTVFKQLSRQKEVPVYYDIQTGITLYCMMRMIRLEAADGYLMATIGLRKLDDAALPVGAKIRIKGKHLPDESETGMVHTFRVESIEKRQGVTVHKFAWLQSDTEAFRREYPRYPIELWASRNQDIHFTVSDISLGGVQLYYHSTLTSALLNSPMQVQLVLDNEIQQLECLPKYIQYNWWEQRHKVGAAFVSLTPKQKEAINRLVEAQAKKHEALAPELISELPVESQVIQPEPAAVMSVAEEPVALKKQNTMIDPESGRIRFV